MEVHLADRSLAARLDDLPEGDRRLVVWLCGLALVALVLGVAYAGGLVLRMAGVVRFDEGPLYQLLTLHATTAFYYWLYFVQAGVILAVLGVYLPSVAAFRWRRLGWVGLALMVGGFVLNTAAPLAGSAVTYVGLANLGTTLPHTGAFYAGYLLLAAGLFCLALVGVRTALAAKANGDRVWPSLAFAGVLWWGLAAVSAIASVNAYLPPLLARFGIRVDTGASYLMNWAVLFHNMHYLPLVSAVVVWYVVAEAATGVSVKAIYSSWFSKAIFAFYLMLVPPTSLYHMFLSPGVSPFVKTVGSVLALGMSVPTLLHFLVILTSLETAARSQGSRGWLTWIRDLPWRNPGFAAVGWAVVCAAGGGIFANVLVQHGFAPMISDTFFVPAYFHFFTAGTVTLTFLGALVYLLPPLLDRPLPSPWLFRQLPAIATLGVYVFGTAGILAGYLGVPRRTVVVAYRTVPDVWSTVLTIVAAGGALMAIALGVYAVALLRVLAGSPDRGLPIREFACVAWGEDVSRSHAVVGGLATVAVLLAGWVVLTVATEAMIDALPMATLAGGGGVVP